MNKFKEGKTLITYYSREGNNYVNGCIVNLPVGNTEVAAKMIQKITGGELFCINTIKKYPEDYTETTKVAQQELRDNARPELSAYLENIDDYEVIILGYPNWWGTMPMPVFTFLEKYDFAGKAILPFCTHEGSGMGRSESDIKKLCPNSKVLKGLAIRGGNVNNSEKDIAHWLKNINI
ncbi:flavodoxin [Petrotoga olearia]|uniref:Flavodoxin n=2 Tax=Petrotoga olearia TaxID=156203 RepID=A0A2K1P5F2_9BACT|nr:flavodoxin [Petrotoga olearia]PNR98002.1 flavodoxin [Petrotoga olearia DSM 13574]RMA75585.1 flavodoxin [Petrotoga olearia]